MKIRNRYAWVMVTILALLVSLTAPAAGEPAGGMHRYAKMMSSDGTAAYVNVCQDLKVRTAKNGSELTDANGNPVQLTPGTFVRILETDGKWALISFDYGTETGMTGYVNAGYLLTYEESATADAEFDELLRKEGFPDDYRTYLLILHSIHPNWKFQAQKVAFVKNGVASSDWNTAVTEETKPGRSLVGYNYRSSWKAKDDDSYIWMDSNGNDGGWVKYDGNHWDPASREMVGFCMDPRNFLSEKAVFMFLSQTYDPAVHTLERVQTMLDGTFMEGEIPGEGVTYAEVFLEAAELSGVSPYMLVARCIQEMGTGGTSSIISGTVEGYENLYNYFDIGAYSHDGRGVIENGLRYAAVTDEASFRPWNTRRKSILGGAIYLMNYVGTGENSGISEENYQNTLYLQKFNVTGQNSFRHEYMTNVLAPAQEAEILYGGLADLEQEFTFRIPVYTNMPKTRCERPNGDGNPNPYLKSLTVEGCDGVLTPKFRYSVTEYDLVTEPEVSSVRVLAEPIAATTSVLKDRTIELEYGMNRKYIICTAENGDKVTYILNIYRSNPEEPIAEPTGTPTGTPTRIPTGTPTGTPTGEPTGTPTGEPTGIPTGTPTEAPLRSDCYRVSEDRITGVLPGTDVSELRNGFSGSAKDSLVITDADGNPVTEGVVGTGYRIGYGKTSVPIIIFGDIDGNGTVSLMDLARLRLHLLQLNPLEGPYRTAACVSRGDDVRLMDLAQLRLHLLGLTSIRQTE